MSSGMKSASVASSFDALQKALLKLLARETSPEEFTSGWLQALVSHACTTQSTLRGGRVRRPASDGTLTAVAAIDWLPAEALDEATSDVSPNHTNDQSSAPTGYERQLAEVYQTGQGKIVPLGGDNPTTGPVVIAPLLVEDQLRGTVELILPPDASPELQRTACEAVGVALGTFAAYERRRRERTLQARQQLMDEIERFTRSVHEKLDLKHTAYAAANDGRRLIGCDRVTILLRRGRRYDVVAASGVDTVENRSEAAKQLGKLAAAVAATGEAVWFQGSNESLAPQLRTALNAYVDLTHHKQEAVLPLVAQPPMSANGRPAKTPLPLGALVVEQIEDDSPAPGREERAKLVAEHATTALAKAIEYEAIPLLPLWRFAAKARLLFAAGTRWKTFAVITLVAAVGAALKFIAADFALVAKGTLQPTDRHHVFAPFDGTVRTIHVRHGDRVRAGQLLVELRNTELDVNLADVTGQRTAASEQLLAVERALYEDSTKLAVQERHRLAGQRSELKQRLAALDEQLRLLRHKREQLRVTSPIDGEVTTWNVEQLLRDRPIRQGQVLVDVADVAGPWELELQVPEDGIGLLLAAQEEHGSALRVSYRLAAEPRTDRGAEIHEVQFAAEVRGEEGNTVLARATLTGEKLPSLRPGAEATAKIYCGRRALGYVWLHDAVDFLRTKVWFRMY